MHEAIEERIQAYEKEILRKLAQMEREDCRQQEAPRLRNRNKAKLQFVSHLTLAPKKAITGASL